MQPKVSVIIPVYNAGKFLNTCLESVINQTLQEIEIICIDDGSLDNSMEILREYASIDSRIKIFQQKNLYAGVARNVGIEHARGEYLVFLDADDFFELSLLEKEYDKITSFNADICLCGANKYDNATGKFHKMPSWLNTKYITREVFNKDILKENIFNVTSACPWTKMFSASFIKSNDLKYQAVPRANDVYFVLSALTLAERIVAVDQELVHYRVNNKDSLQSNNKKSPKVFLEALDAVADRVDLSNRNEEYKQAFTNIAMNHIAYNLRTLEASNSFDAFLMVVEDLKKYYLDKFLMKDKPSNYFFNKNDLRYLIDKEIFSPSEIILSDSIESSKNTETNIFLTFIVPVYNCEKYIEECIMSLSNQTYSNIEIICIDDSSNDKSFEILTRLAKIDSRIHLITHSKNKGAGGARNSGLNCAKGEYIWFVDGDDHIDLDAVEKLYAIVERHNHSIDLLAFNAEAYTNINGNNVSSTGSIIRNWPKDKLLSIPDDNALIPNTIEGSSVTYIAKNEFVNTYRFRENVTFEDADFSFKIYTSNKKFLVLDYAPYHRRTRSDSITGDSASGLNESCIKGRLQAAKVILAYIEEHHINKDYALNWFKNWSRWASELYIKNITIHTEEYHKIVQLLQKKLNLFSLDKAVEYKDIVIPNIIISLTTIPERIKDVDKVIKSLLNQTVSANKIKLYLGREQITFEDVPKELFGVSKINPKFTINFCEDIKPHKKYYYSFKEHPEDIIITVDDDVIYDKNLIKNLLSSYIQFPDAVSCMRGHFIKIYDEMTLAPYKKWTTEDKIIQTPSLLLLPTGVGGVLYPPHCFSKMIFNLKRFRKVALFTDDLWLKWMQLKLNTKCVLVSKHENLKIIEGSQENALWHENLTNNKNDIALKNILSDDNQLNILNQNILEELYNESLNLKRDTVVNQELSNFYKQELDNVKSGYSFRIGRVITWLPRKIRGGIQCYKDNGGVYTIKRTIEHMGIDMKTGDFQR